MSCPLPHALVSIHDVMPATLDKVERLCEAARECGIDKLTLLVVPGQDWSGRELDRLRAWEASGCRLAGHGWQHRCRSINRWRHRLHSWVLSRNVAEHLSADADEILDLMHRCHDWFAARGLRSPRLYVPPAWALGSVPHRRLHALPFRLIETLDGVLDVGCGAKIRLPLVGFEADNRLRQATLGGLNRLNRWVARGLNRPLRVALHPHDLQLRLSAEVRRTLASIGTCLDYEDLLAEPHAA